MNKLLFLGSFLSVVLVISTPLAQAEDSPKLNVGVILPFTGDAASFGTAIRNGLMLGYDKLSPNVKNKIALSFEDDSLIPMNTISAFNKLASRNKIHVAINASSGTAKALAPIAESKGIPLLAIASDPEIVSQRKYVVNFWVTPEEEMRVALPEMTRRGYSKVARISTIHAFPLALNRELDRVNKGSVQLVLDEGYPPENKDFRTYITKLRATPEVDAVLMVLMPGQLGIFAKQLRQMGVTLPLCGFEILEDSNEVKLSENALVGAWYVNAANPDDSFLTEYQKQYPNDSLFGAANGHDIALVLGAAVEKLGPKLNAETLNEHLHTLKDFTGALGTYSASGDNRYTLPAMVKQVTKDGFEQL